MRRKLLLVLAGLTAAGLSMPFLRAERFRTRIHTALEQALHRKVDITGKMRFSVWPGLGFSIEKVVIYEDPAVSLEPFAYVAALDATVSLTAMLQRRWEVSTIVLDEPTVNLVKQDSGSWNIQPLLRETAASPLGRFPEIRVRTGRINLKFGETKSVLYFTNADLDVTAGPSNEVEVRFTLEPARTDRPAQGIGTMQGQGRYQWKRGGPGDLDLDLELERSALSEIVTLLEGRGAGMRGFLTSKAKVKGPINDLKIEGSLRLEDIQRWDLLRTASGNSALRYRGKLDFPAGEFQLETLSDAATAPVRLRMRGHRLLDNASWGTLAQFNEFPVAALREVLQFMNVSLPQGASLDGKLSGVLGYSPAHGLQGVLKMAEASVKSGTAAFQLRDATVAMDGERFHLKPARLDLGGQRLAEVEGRYSPAGHSLTWRTGSTAMPVKDLLEYHRHLTGSDIPLLHQVAKGEWLGTLEYSKQGEEPGQWNGQFELRKVQLDVPGLAAPVDVEGARGVLVKNHASLETMQASAGDVKFTASYQEVDSARPYRLKVAAEELDVSALERLFLPTLKRNSGFLRTLSFRAPLPEWLKERHLDAQVRIDSLLAGELWLGSLSGRLLWDGAQVELTNANWQRESAAGTGRMRLSLGRTEPAYRLTVEVKDLPWRGGEMEGEGTVETSGTGVTLLKNARSSGKFQGHSIVFPPDSDFRSVAGVYEFSVPRGTPLLRLNGIEATCGLDQYTGQGVSETDGRLVVDLSSATKKMRMSGTVWPFQLEMLSR